MGRINQPAKTAVDIALAPVQQAVKAPQQQTKYFVKNQSAACRNSGNFGDGAHSNCNSTPTTIPCSKHGVRGGIVGLAVGGIGTIGLGVGGTTRGVIGVGGLGPFSKSHTNAAAK